MKYGFIKINKKELEKIRKNSKTLLHKQILRLSNDDKVKLFCYIYALYEIFTSDTNLNKILVKEIISDISILENYSDELLKNIIKDSVEMVIENKSDIKNDELIKTILLFELYTL